MPSGWAVKCFSWIHQDSKHVSPLHIILAFLLPLRTSCKGLAKKIAPWNKGSIILKTQTMHYYRGNPSNCHTFLLFDLPQAGNLMTPVERGLIWGLSSNVFESINLHKNGGCLTNSKNPEKVQWKWFQGRKQ